MHEALYYTTEYEGKVRCNLCPHNCLVSSGKKGKCRVRYNQNGKLYSGVYGRIAASHSDPIEKKPLYHFFPGHKIFSLGSPGCNLRCLFCQNFTLSQCETHDVIKQLDLSPRQLVDYALGIPGNIGIAYTYNEPTVFYEMMLEAAALARNTGLKNVVISNGFINEEPLKQLLPFIDAFNIDLKAFNDGFYQKITGGRLLPVLDTLKTIFKAGKHLEINMLVIPTLNDTEIEFTEMLNWIISELSPDVPLHLSRYFPSWKMELPPTSNETLQHLTKLASEKLNYVFTGNIAETYYSNTTCPDCHNLLIERQRYNTRILGLTVNGKCNSCGAQIPILF
jgi:pyruvate formate lyase activating enzyme